MKVLSSSGVALYSDDTNKALEAKHPYKPPPFMPSKTFYEPPLVAKIDSVFVCIKSLPKEGSATATDLLKAIMAVDSAYCSRHYMEMVGFQGCMKGVGKEMSKYLSDFQFRVRVSGDAEVVLHSVNRLLSEYHNDGSLVMLNVDFSNAFNLVDRSALLHEVRVRCPSISLWVDFLYGQAMNLYIGDTHIWSATGVQQGDPLGTLLFALGLHPLVHKIRDNCKLLLYAWYLDDGIVIRDSKEVARVLEIIKVSGPSLGLKLNIKKTEIFWPSCNGVKLREGLFHVDIRRLSLGVKLLGGAVSKDADFISRIAMRRAANVVDLMNLLPRIIYDLPSSRMEEVAGRGGRRKKVVGRSGRRNKVTGKGGRHEEGVWSVEPDLLRSGGRRWKKPWRLYTCPYLQAYVTCDDDLLLLCFVSHGLQTPVFWQGSHSYTVVAAIDSVLYGSYISGSEPQSMRLFYSVSNGL
ncbi:putative reverse transcriptase domain-containing protein [Tanacetum coccineum]